MAANTGSAWLPRLCFWLAVAAAAGLIGLVVLAPILDQATPQPHAASRIIAVFARDATMRRTALAGAVGLLVTACVFFRPPLKSWALRSRQNRPPPPINVVGA